MRAIWSGTISFGLVNIPINLYSAIQSQTLDFDLLRRNDLCPIRYARVCRADGKEVPWEDIVKGYEYKEGDYVILEKEDFEKANVEKTNTIDIHTFVKESEIDSLFFEKPYYLEPEKTGQKAYALLKAALKKSKMVAIASFVLRNREHIATIKPYGNLLVLNQLRYHDEIREHEELSLPSEDLVKASELKVALELVKQSATKFNPDQYEDTYIKDLKKLIEAKAKGHKLKKPKAARTPSEVVDIMSLLKKSLKDNKKSAA